MAKVVPISDVTVRPGEHISRYGVRKIKEILDRQGLIEPLIVDGQMRVGRRVWDAERLIAAQELGWDTVLITDGTY